MVAWLLLALLPPGALQLILGALRVRQESTKMRQVLQFVTSVRQARIWRQSATMRSPIVWHVQRASTQTSMAHRPSQRASTVCQTRTLQQLGLSKLDLQRLSIKLEVASGQRSFDELHLQRGVFWARWRHVHRGVFVRRVC